MAEPARQLGPYDHEDEAPNERPKFGVIHGGGETSSPQGNLHAVPDVKDAEEKASKDHGGLRGIDGGRKDSGSAGAKTAGANPHADNIGDRIGQGFNPTDASKLGFAFAVGKLWAGVTGNKKLLAGGGGAGGVLVLIVVGFFALGTLKVEHIVDNLQDHFEASSTNAIDNETRSLFTNYITEHVLPAYKHCGSTISKDCSVKISPSKNPVTQLYHAWAQSKIENKLANNGAHSIEFKYNSTSRTWHVITPTTSADGEDIGANGEKLEQVFTKRADVRAAVDSSLADETLWKKIVTRYQIGSLLQEKYGIKRCIVFCGVKDALADNISAEKKAAQIYFVDRVLIPRTQIVGLAVKCALDENCDPTKTTSEPCAEGSDCALNDEPESDTERAITTELASETAQDGAEDTEELVNHVNQIDEKGLNQYLVEQMLQLVFDESTSGSIADKLPFIGWINLASKIVNGANGAGPKLKKLSYIVNAAAAVNLYMMYRTYADEIHTGHVTATEVGSFTNSLGPGLQTKNAKDVQVGGTADATQTPLYANIIDDVPNATPSKDYLCNNGQPIPAGQQICPEEAPGVGSNLANTIHDFLNLPGVNVITALAKLWRDTFGQIFNFVNGIFSITLTPVLKGLDAGCSLPGQPTNQIIPGYCVERQIFLKSAKVIAPLILQGIARWLLPDPFGQYESGGRKGDLNILGADVGYNDFAHNGIGGQELTPTQTAMIRTNQQAEEQTQFAQKPLFARVFDTTSDYSLVSRLAMDTPPSLGSIETSFVGFISNPLALVGHSFSSLFLGRIDAAAAAQPDPFGIPQYGYPSVPNDPEAYWNKHCADNANVDQDAMTVAYNNAAANGPTDPDTGMPVNKTTDPCLLISNVVGADGGKYDTSLLSPDDVDQTGVGGN